MSWHRVENYRLRMYMDQADAAALHDFFERYEKSYVVEKPLRRLDPLAGQTLIVAGG